MRVPYRPNWSLFVFKINSKPWERKGVHEMGCCYPVGKNCKVQFPSDPSVSRRISNESALLVFYQLVGPRRGCRIKVPGRPNWSLQRTLVPRAAELGRYALPREHVVPCGGANDQSEVHDGQDQIGCHLWDYGFFAGWWW